LGVPDSAIVEFAVIRDTVDALQAHSIVDRYGATFLVVVSSDFHLERVKFIFGEIFPVWIIQKRLRARAASFSETLSKMLKLEKENA